MKALYAFEPVAAGLAPLLQWLFLNAMASGSGPGYIDFGSVALCDDAGQALPAFSAWLDGQDAAEREVTRFSSRNKTEA